MSPQIVTGDLTGCTFDSSNRISLAYFVLKNWSLSRNITLSQRPLTSISERCWHCNNCSMYLSKLLISDWESLSVILKIQKFIFVKLVFIESDENLFVFFF